MILLIGSCGYLGSALYRFITPFYQIDSVDLEWRGNPGILSNQKTDYGHLSRSFLGEYDTVILLAAHSSVAATQVDPQGAFVNNTVSFQRLLDRLRPDQRIIYASSSSIYSGFGARAATEYSATVGNMYDLTKFVDDALAEFSPVRTYGLRLGTVNGPSPNTRYDLMLNRMVLNAMTDNRVVISNPLVHRPILGMHDFCRAVTSILNGDYEPGIYNLASFNATVASLGAAVADEMDVPLILGEPTPTYDFEIDTTKFQEARSFQFQETAASIVRDLREAYSGSSQ